MQLFACCIVCTKPVTPGSLPLGSIGLVTPLAVRAGPPRDCGGLYCGGLSRGTSRGADSALRVADSALSRDGGACCQRAPLVSSRP